MRYKVAKVCLSLVLACTLVVSPFVRAEKAYAFAPAIAAAASAWGVSEGAVVAGVSALAAACGVTFISGTQTGLDWDTIDSVDDFLVISEAESILAEAAEQNGGGYDPKKNNGGGNFLECVKQLATVGAITGVGSAVNAGVNFLLDQLFPNPDISSTALVPIFSNTATVGGIDILLADTPPLVSWDDNTTWAAATYLSTSDFVYIGNTKYYYDICISYGSSDSVVWNCSNKGSYYQAVLSSGKSDGVCFYYSNGNYIGSVPSNWGFYPGSRSDRITYINPNYVGTYQFPSANLSNGTWSGDYQLSTKLDSDYEIANAPDSLISSVNAAATAASDAANRAQAIADATQAVLDNLASTGSSIQTTPSTSNDRHDYVTTEPIVEPVEPTEPADPDAPFDWNQFLQPDLYLVFPFCLPWDIYQVVSLLSSSAEAPVFDLPFKVPVEGGEYKVHIDLSVFDPVAEVIRAMELLAVAAGLIFLTKKMIEN